MNGAGIYSSALNFSGTQGNQQLYYNDQNGDLTYAVGKWTNAAGTVSLNARDTVISNGTAMRQWVMSKDGKIHYAGSIANISGNVEQANFTIMVNGQILKQQSFTAGTAIDGVYYGKKDDRVKFILSSGSQTVQQYRTEFYVDFTRQAPVPLVPSNNAKDVDLQPLFQWSHVDSVQEYVFTLADNPDLNAPIVRQEGITSNQYSFAGKLEPNKMYYWKVTAKNADETWETTAPVAAFQTTDSNKQVVFYEVLT
jgi:hypothetical protein